MFPFGNCQRVMAPLRPFVPERDQAERWGGTAIHSLRDLGAALQVARKALRLTQADLALAAGVGLRFVVELEAGKQAALSIQRPVAGAAAGHRAVAELATNGRGASQQSLPPRARDRPGTAAAALFRFDE